MDMTGEASHFDLTHPFFLWESENNILPYVFLNGLNELQHSAWCLLWISNEVVYI
jgi:hypothetical protein